MVSLLAHVAGIPVEEVLPAVVVAGLAAARAAAVKLRGIRPGRP